MKKVILSISLVIVLYSIAAAQLTVHGVKLPEKLGKEDKLLMLNGGGVRNKYFMNVYVAGLYVISKAPTRRNL